MTDKLRVAYLMSNTLGYNGVSKVILGYVENLDPNQFTVDIIVSEGIQPTFQNLLLEKDNKKTYSVIKTNHKRINMISYSIELFSILKKNEYDIVHVHGNSSTMSLELFIAYLARVHLRIAHSHSIKSKSKFVDIIFRPLLNFLSTVRIAPSKEVGRKRYFRNYQVLPNAIDLNKHYYDPDLKAKTKEKIGLTDNFILGHVGHFTDIKNHDFIIDVFSVLRPRIPNSVLLLVGDGPNRTAIETRVRKEGLLEAVFFLGNREDINQLMNVFDVFIFPSISEGFGIVALEAQLANCMCFVSNGVPNVLEVSNFIEFKSLEDSAEKWAESIENFYHSPYDQCFFKEKINEMSLKNVVSSLEAIYLANIKGR